MTEQKKTRKTHGLSHTVEYRLWRSMIERCKANEIYGRQGITVCEEWQKSFIAFYEHVGARPSPEHQLDRLAGGTSAYEPGNVAWVSRKENCRNRTNNRILEFNGESRCIAEWAEILGLNRAVIESRLRHGWDIEKTLSTPNLKRPPKEKRKNLVDPSLFPPIPKAQRTIELNGKRFLSLTVIHHTRNSKGASAWLCKCDCGNYIVTASQSLRKGFTTTCGCKIGKPCNFATHGLSDTPEYKVWGDMIYRCKTDKTYVKLGINVCPEWKESFEVFYQYLKDTIGLKPSQKHQLDRIRGNDSNYEPDNIRWLTNKENSNNKTDNVFWTFREETLTISQWADKTGIKSGTLAMRVQRGWSIEKALTTPVRRW